MSDTFDHNATHDDDLLAAEYALGVLAGASVPPRSSASRASPPLPGL
jgi:hypothetical protein